MIMLLAVLLALAMLTLFILYTLLKITKNKLANAHRVIEQKNKEIARVKQAKQIKQNVNRLSDSDVDDRLQQDYRD